MAFTALSKPCERERERETKAKLKNSLNSAENSSLNLRQNLSENSNSNLKTSSNLNKNSANSSEISSSNFSKNSVNSNENSISNQTENSNSNLNKNSVNLNENSSLNFSKNSVNFNEISSSNLNKNSANSSKISSLNQTENSNSNLNKNSINPSENSHPNSSQIPFDFHILSNEISPQTRDKLAKFEQSLNEIYPCQISTHIVDESPFRALPSWGYENAKNYATYYRLLLTHFLPANADKCLYLDCDMLVLCDVRELFELNLGSKLVATSSGYVEDGHKFDLNRTLRGVKKRRKCFDFRKKSYYFCAGFMLINLAKWREMDIQGKCFDFLSRFVPKFCDQDTLNAVIEESDILKMPPEYAIYIHPVPDFLKNPKYPHKERLKEALKNAQIVHFSGYAHPWFSKWRGLGDDILPLDYPLQDKWWEIALQTPIFREDLVQIKANLQSAQIMINDYAHAMSEKFKLLQNRFEALQKGSLSHIIKKKIYFNLIRKPLGDALNFIFRKSSKSEKN